MRTIEYTLRLSGISPTDMQDGGVQGDHNKTAVVFKPDDALWGDLTTGIPANHSPRCRVDVTDGCGGFHASELLTPDKTSHTVSYAVPRDITQAGGVANLFLVLSEVDENNREVRTLYTYPARLRFAASSAGSTSEEAYKTQISGALAAVLKALEEFRGAFPVHTSRIADKAVTTAKLAERAVTEAKLADSAVTTAKIAGGAVTRDKLGQGAVGEDELADGAVTTPKIADWSITSDKLKKKSIRRDLLADDIFWNYYSGSFDDLTDYGLYVVRASGGAPPGTSASTFALIVISSGSTIQIAIPNDSKCDIYIRSYDGSVQGWGAWRCVTEVEDRSISTEKLAVGAVTTEKLADHSVNTDQVALKSIKGEHIKDYAIGWGHLQDNAVVTQKIKDGNVTSSKLADGSVTADKLAELSITTSQLADGAVTAAKLGNGAVTKDALAMGGAVKTYNGYLDQLEYPGMYYCNNPEGVPRRESLGVIVNRTSPITLHQTIYYGNGDVYTRYQALSDDPKWTAWKLLGSDLAYKGILDDNANNCFIPGVYMVYGGQTWWNDPLRVGEGDMLIVMQDDAGVMSQIVIGPKTHFRQYVDGAWTAFTTPERDLTADDIVDGAIKTAKLADKSVTAAKLADGVLPARPENLVSAPEDLPDGKVLLGGGGKTAAAGDYTVEAVVPSEGYVRFACEQSDGIRLALDTGKPMTTPCTLSLEARWVSGYEGVEVGPLLPNASIYHWDTGSYLRLESDWSAAVLTNITDLSAVNLFVYTSAAVELDIRNIRLIDQDGNDLLDHAAFEALGAYHPGIEDTPENHMLPTLAKMRALLTGLEERIAELETNGVGYKLPAATSEKLGGVKIGDGVEVTVDGTLSGGLNPELEATETEIDQALDGTLE